MTDRNSQLARLINMTQARPGKKYEIFIHHEFKTSYANTREFGPQIYNEFRSTANSVGAHPLTRVVLAGRAEFQAKFKPTSANNWFISSENLTQDEAICVISEFVEAAACFGVEHLHDFESDKYQIRIDEMDGGHDAERLIEKIEVFRSADWDAMRTAYCTQEAKESFRLRLIDPKNHKSGFRREVATKAEQASVPRESDSPVFRSRRNHDGFR